MTDRFVILGATGDLTSRELVPALAQLVDGGHLSEPPEIVGVAPDDWDDDGFRRHLQKALDEHCPDVAAEVRDALVSRAGYRRADATDADELGAVITDGSSPAVVYLALPPAVFEPALAAIAGVDLPSGSRIVVEKPFGEDLESARRLNRHIHRCLPEDAVFRMDHFLGKQTVQNILGLRFANRVLEPVWNATHIERVEIVWDETLALEGRAGYYDRIGALRDMIQNHLLQVLGLVAMEAPLTLSARDLRDRKAEVLRAVRSPSSEDIEADTVRARYTAGDGRPAYVDEPDVDPERDIETFAEVTLWIDNWRWAGVPFKLRTGKALAADRRHVAVAFRPVPHVAFGQSTPARPNELRLEMSPDRLALGIDINGPGDPFELERVELAHELAPQSPDAYARLLLDVIEGDPTLSIRDDEAEEGWRIVEPILEAWDRDAVPMREYPAGSDGPDD